MWISPELFKVAEKLKASGYAPALEPGIRVARGFADVGFEEFVILPNGNLMSLFTGEQRPIKDGEIEHLVVVPDVDMITDQLIAHGMNGFHVELLKSNRWSFVHKGAQLAEDRELHLVLMKSLVRQREEGSV